MEKTGKPQKRKGGRRSKDKGNRNERGLVRALQLAGIAAERTPMSGAVRSTRFGGGYDVSIPLFNQDMRAELKHHGNGFQRLYKWLEPVDILIVRCDHAEPLAILPLNRLVELSMKAANDSNKRHRNT